MKKLLLILLLSVSMVLFSCKNDTGPYIQVKNIENLIYEAIRDFRVAEGEDGPFVHQYFVVGVESDTEGNNYITVLLAKADS